jgi:uncharacterized membrane protein YbhN (UPF0104 family)
MSSLLSSPRVRKTALRIIPITFYLLLVAFLVIYLKSVDFSKLAHLHLNWWYLLLASIVGLLTRYIGTFIWFVILRSLGARDLHLQKQLIYVYAKSWMGRYIPGTAPWILGKIYFASKHGIPKQKLAVSSLLEGGLQVMSTLILSFALLAFDSRLDVLNTALKILMVIVAVIGVVALIPPVFNRWVSFVYKLIRKKSLPSEHLASGSTVLRGSSLYLVNACINGLSLFFIAKGIDPSLSYHNMLFAIGASSLAAAASMIAIFAPSGLGVREGIQLVLFSLIMPKDLAVAVTIATRLWSVGVDFIFFGLSKFIAGKPDSNA